MERMKVAICDDIPAVLEEVRELLKEMDLVSQIHVFSDMEAFFGSQETEIYDAVIMDIDWKMEKTGLDFAERLKIMSPSTQIIYMTAYTLEYVEDIFLQASNLSGFLRKPVNRISLQKNLEKIRRQKLEEEGRLVIRQKGSLLSIAFRDMLYLENQLHKTKIVLHDREYLCNENLEHIKKRLGEPFLTVHKSYLVNMEQIVEFRNGEVLLFGNHSVPVSKTRYAEAKSKFFDYMSKRL